jgi:hypothetical protein
MYSLATVVSENGVTTAAKMPYKSADSYGRYLPKVSDGVELAVAASSCM